MKKKSHSAGKGRIHSRWLCHALPPYLSISLLCVQTRHRKTWENTATSFRVLQDWAKEISRLMHENYIANLFLFTFTTPQTRTADPPQIKTLL